jgi:hypothetical protein
LDSTYRKNFSIVTEDDSDSVLHLACKVNGGNVKDKEICWLLKHFPEFTHLANKNYASYQPWHVAATWCGEDHRPEMLKEN